MTLLGPNDLKQFALPATWDAAYLRNVALKSGETYEQLINDIAAGIALANAAMLTDPLYAGLVSLTTDITSEYRSGSSSGFEDHSEYTKPDAKRGATAGHMLPMLPYDRGMGWTWDFLRNARRTQIDADIASAVDDLRNIWQKKILTRLFKSTYDTVGSTGKSVPLADGGTADSTYVPVARPDRGGTFLYTHTHIKYLSGITQANLVTAVATLWEHGYDGPYDMTIAQADIAAWSTVANVTGWIPRSVPEIQYGISTTTAAGIDASYIGVINTIYGAVRVRATGRIPTAYWEVHKSFGNLDQRNPLIVRESPTYGTGAVLLAGDHIRQFPLEYAVMFLEFGVGINNRIGAVVVKNDAGSYTDPTIA